MDKQERIALARSRTGLSPSAFAEKVGSSDRSVKRWEKGITEPADTTLRKIAEVSGLDFEWLDTGRGEVPKPLPPEGNGQSNLAEEPTLGADDKAALEIGRRILKGSARQTVYGPEGDVLQESVLLWYPIRGERVRVFTDTIVRHTEKGE